MKDRMDDADYDEDVDPEDLDEDLDEDEFDATRSGRLDALKRGGRRVLGEVAQHGRERITYAADRGKNRIADRLEYGAGYLRNDIDVIHDDFVRAVQRNPLATAAIAVGVGFVLGRALTPPGFGRKKKDSLGSQLSKTLMSTAAAILAARLKSIVVVDDDDGYEEPEPPPKKRARKKARPRQAP